MIAVIAAAAVFALTQIVVACVVIDAATSDGDKDKPPTTPQAATTPTTTPQATTNPPPRKTRPANPTHTPKPTPSITRLAWRSERLADGSVRTVVGDVDAAPRDSSWVGGDDYHTAENKGREKIVKVHGWWCAVKAAPTLTYATGTLSSPGFTAQCANRPRKMRVRHQFTRSSWTGMRSYTSYRETPWTTAQSQTSGPLTARCPTGRTGTYDYQLRAVIEIDGYVIGELPALSTDDYRGDCGTGTS